LHRRRLDSGLTQERLARELDVDRSTVIRWEHDERVPGLRHRLRLAELLGGTPATYAAG
jgi:transcriptional regulator with XRE-family HTH domain